jgi:hypothetical protein
MQGVAQSAVGWGGEHGREGSAVEEEGRRRMDVEVTLRGV